MYEADRALVSRMRAGEQRAFDEFFNANAPRLVALVARRCSMDPANMEDIVQSALVKAVRNLASYRGEAALFTWVAEICRHELADAQRKEARRPAHVSLDLKELSPTVLDQLRIPEHEEPHAKLAVGSLRAAIVRVLDGLPPHYSRALEAKYGDGMSVAEIAAELGMAEVAVQSLLARAREAFRQRWSDAS